MGREICCDAQQAPRQGGDCRQWQRRSGQTRDLPASDAIPLHVMWPANENSRPLRYLTFRGSVTHPTQPLRTLRVRRHRRLTQHSLPGGLRVPTCAGLAPAGSHQLSAGALIQSPRRRAIASGWKRSGRAPWRLRDLLRIRTWWTARLAVLWAWRLRMLPV